MGRTSNPQIRKKYKINQPFFIPDMIPGATNITDVKTGVTASCSISGTRYGLVNGVVAAFGSNVPTVEDTGLRGCPAFTSYWYPATLGSDVSHTIENGWNKISLINNTGGYTFVRSSMPYTTVGESTIIQAIIRKGSARYLGFRARMIANSGFTVAVFDFNNGSFTTLNNHVVVFVKNIATDTYHVCLRYVATDTNGYLSGVSLCTYDGLEISLGGTIGQSAYFISLTATVGANITSLGRPNPTGITSYVSEVGSSSNGTSFDLDDVRLARLKTALRGPNAQGHIELEFESNVDSGWLLNGVDTYFPLLTCADNNTRGILFRKQSFDNALVWRITDTAPSTLTITQNPFVVGQTFKISVDYGTYTDGALKMRLTVNGVKSSIGAFSGSFGSQDLRFFFGNTVHAGWIKNIKISPRPIW